jgi:hypothetical protein
MPGESTPSSLVTKIRSPSRDGTVAALSTTILASIWGLVPWLSSSLMTAPAS